MPVSPLSITNTTTRTGYTVGAGGESRLWSNWFVRGEYRFADYGTASYVNTVGASPGGGWWWLPTRRWYHCCYAKVTRRLTVPGR